MTELDVPGGPRIRIVETEKAKTKTLLIDWNKDGKWDAGSSTPTGRACAGSTPTETASPSAASSRRSPSRIQTRSAASRLPPTPAALTAGNTVKLPKWADLTIDGRPADGIAWESARSNLPCLALSERAADGIACPPSGRCSFPLTQPHVRNELLTLVRDFGYTLAP